MPKIPSALGLIVLSILSEPRPVGSSGQIGEGWATVRRGTSTPPLEFTKQGLILFREGECRLEVAQEDDTTTEVQFSALSPDGEYRIVIRGVYEAEPGYLLDVKKCGLMHLPLPRYFQPWVSWSPDGKHALFYTNYEASPELWVLDVETGQVLEVHRSGLAPKANTCCGLNEWAPKSGVGYLVPESVRWKDAVNFAFRVAIFCNPYSEEGGWPCETGDIDHAHAAFEVSVTLDPPKVTSGPMTRLSIRQKPQKR